MFQDADKQLLKLRPIGLAAFIVDKLAEKSEQNLVGSVSYVLRSGLQDS